MLIHFEENLRYDPSRSVSLCNLICLFDSDDVYTGWKIGLLKM